MLKAMAEYLDGAKGDVLPASPRRPAPRRPTRGSTSTAGSGRCSPTPAAGGASCPTRRSTSTAPTEALSKGGDVRRPAHLRAARGRGRPHQRLQLPRLGNAREAVADAARWRAGDREAGDGHLVPHRGGVPGDDRVADPPRGQRSSSSAAAPATCSTTSTRRTRSRSPARRRPAGCSSRHRAIAGENVRFNMEADSLNCSMLGPDARARHRGVRPLHQGSRDAR